MNVCSFSVGVAIEPVVELVCLQIASAGPAPFVLLSQQGTNETSRRVLAGEDPNHLFSAPDLLNEPLQHVCRPKPPVVLLRQGEDSSCLEETILEGIHCIRGLLTQFAGMFFEPLDGLLLGLGFEDLVTESLHLVVVVGRRLIEHVALEVGLAPIPDAAWEASSQGLLQALMSVAYGELNASEALLL